MPTIPPPPVPAPSPGAVGPCLSPEAALSFVSSRIDPNDPYAEWVYRHLERCTSCRVVLAEAAAAVTG